jgi:hypothetical protein
MHSRLQLFYYVITVGQVIKKFAKNRSLASTFSCRHGCTIKSGLKARIYISRFIFFPGEAKTAKELRIQIRATDTGKIYPLMLKF